MIRQNAPLRMWRDILDYSEKWVGDGGEYVVELICSRGFLEGIVGERVEVLGHEVEGREGI